MEKLKQKEWITDVVVELIGSFLTAIALYNFAVNAEFPMTGFSGIALIFYRLFGWSIGWTTIVLNIPVAVLCYRLLGKEFFLKSVRCMIVSSLMVDYVAPLFPVYTGGRLLAALCTGVIGGLGYTMIYMRNSSTGGMDFIIMSVKAVKPHLSLGKVVFMSDIGVILLGGYIFKDMDGIIYGLIIDYLFAVMVDKIMYGMNSGKLSLIVTTKGVQMCQMIDEHSGRGTTLLNARGGYRQDEKDVVMCACSTRQMHEVEQSVKKIDPESFMIVMESNEVLGNGFKVTRVAERKNDRNKFQKGIGNKQNRIDGSTSFPVS